MKTERVKKHVPISITFSHFGDIPYDIEFDETDVLNNKPISYCLNITNDGERYLITPTDFKIETNVFISVEKKWLEGEDEVTFIKNLGEFKDIGNCYKRELTPEALDALFNSAETFCYKSQVLREPLVTLTINQLDLSVDSDDYVMLEVSL